MPNLKFCEGRKQAMTKFILFMNLDMVDRNSAPEEFACIWQSKRVGSDGDFTSNWKFPDCVHFFSAWAGQAVIVTIAVVYEHTRRTHWDVFADWAQYKYKAFFVPNQEPASAWIFGNGLVRVSTQGLFRLYLKTFVQPFLPTRLTAPGSPRMAYDPNAGRTVFRGGGGESGIRPSGEKYVIAEVKFLHFKHPARFGGKSLGRPDF